MCGRYAATLPAASIAALFQIEGPLPSWAGTWNMAPTKSAPVIRRHPETGERHLGLLRWGLVPYWAKDLKATAHPINARGETVARAPMFRDAFARRRCLIPADAFYEWQTTATGNLPPAGNLPPTGKLPPAIKLPRAIARADGAPLVFGGLWEGWRGPGGTIVRSFSIITTAANQALRHLHERMPVVVEEPDRALWLGEAPGDPRDLVRPSAAGFRTWRVGTAVNNVRNDSAALLDPV